jgi:peptidoglycan/LPS O-acetylase OafA/YrhL
MASSLTAAPLAERSHKPHSRYVPELDGVRGIAILMVIAFHFGLYGVDGYGLHLLYTSAVGLGWAGVDLFFVLSGCLITGILLDTKDSEHYFRSFYMRRILRILPLYYLCVFFFFCLLLPIGSVFAPGWLHQQDWAQVGRGEAVWYWLHLSNWRSAFGILQTSPITHFWSLAIEEQFYLVWPVIVLYCSERGLLRLSIGLILLSAGLRNIPEFQALVATYPDFVYRITPFRVDPLAFGAILALLSRRAAFREWGRRWLWIPGTIAAGVLLSIVLTLHSSSYRSEPMSRYGFTAVSVICFSVVACSLLNTASDAPVARLLRIPPLVSIGKYSYGMYVLHLPVAFFWPGVLQRFAISQDHISSAAASILSGIVISYLMAWVSWHLIEHRFLRLKDRFSYR